VLCGKEKKIACPPCCRRGVRKKGGEKFRETIALHFSSTRKKEKGFWKKKEENCTALHSRKKREEGENVFASSIWPKRKRGPEKKRKEELAAVRTVQLSRNCLWHLRRRGREEEIEEKEGEPTFLSNSSNRKGEEGSDLRAFALFIGATRGRKKKGEIKGMRCAYRLVLQGKGRGACGERGALICTSSLAHGQASRKREEKGKR